MIGYKQVYKKDSKYYSLMNYGYCCFNKDFLTAYPPYEIGKIYIDDGKEYKSLKQQFLYKQGRIPKFIKTGFYFWKENYPIRKEAKERMRRLGADINTILKCEIKKEDILSFERNGGCIRAKQFKILEEVNIGVF